VVPPASLQRAVTSCLGALTWVAPLTAELVANWVADGTAAAIMEKRVRTAAERQGLAEELLGPGLVRSAIPTYHLWLPLPEPWRVDIVARMLEAGPAAHALPGV
jgi:DNA-binding transcriptional MocR family regulator